MICRIPRLTMRWSEPRAAVKIVVPPYIVARLRNALRELSGGIDVVSGITEKNPGHGASRWTTQVCSEPLRGSSAGVNKM